MESIMEALCQSGSLFEVPVPDYKQLKACRKEVCLLKELWDMIIMVRGDHKLQGAGGGTSPPQGNVPARSCPLGVKMQQVSWSLMEAPKGPQDGSLHESISVDLVLGTWMLTLCGLPLSPPSSSSFSLTSHLSLRTKNKAGPPSLLERMALAVFVSTSH